MTRLKIVAGFFFMLLAQCTVAQVPDSLRLDTIEKEDVEEIMFGKILDNTPMFCGGCQKLLEFIETNLVYPQEAIDAGIEGKVYVGFYIEKDGAISDAQVLRGIGYGCDEEALRVIGLMPKWIPGKQRGQCVRVRYMLPIKFELSNHVEKPVLYEYVAPEVGEVENYDMVDVYTIVEQKPEFPGGQEALDKYIKENYKFAEILNEYQIDVSGRIFVYFIVETDGSISNVKVLRGLEEHFDEEAVRVVKSMPHWIPGKQNGQPVRVAFTLPVIIKW